MRVARVEVVGVLALPVEGLARPPAPGPSRSMCAAREGGQLLLAEVVAHHRPPGSRARRTTRPPRRRRRCRPAPSRPCRTASPRCRTRRCRRPGWTSSTSMYLPMMGASSRLTLGGHELGGGHERVAQRVRALAGRRGAPAGAARRRAARPWPWRCSAPGSAMTCSTVTESCVGVPAVVVGDHGQRRVADLGLAGELGLLQVRHADDVHAPRAVQLATRRASRTAGPRCRRRCRRRGWMAPASAQASRQDAESPAQNGMREGHVGHQARGRRRSTRRCVRAVHELVGDHHVQRRVLLLQRAHRGHGEDALHAQRLQREDVGAEVQLGRAGGGGRGAWRGRKATRLPSSSPTTIASDGLPERRLRRRPRALREALHLVEAAAADDPDLGVLLHPAPRERRPSALSGSRAKPGY